MGIINKIRLAKKGITQQELEKKEKNVGNMLNNMADHTGNLLKQTVPQAYKNMTCRGAMAGSCRLGDPRKSGAERPFSGATVVSDFSCHSHR